MDTNSATDHAEHQDDYLKPFVANNRLSREKELGIYQDMSHVVRKKLIILTNNLTNNKLPISLLESFIELVELTINKSNKLTPLLEHKSYLAIVNAIDEIKVFSFLGDDKAIYRSNKKLKRYLIEWPLPDYISVQSAHQLLTKLPQEIKAEGLDESSLDIQNLISSYRQSRNKLTRSNIGLVYKIASRFHYLGLSHDDLIQEGTLGLIKAIERFDPDKGFQFSSYAYRVISQQIHAAIEQQGTIVRRPYNELRELAVVDQTRIRLEQELLRAPKGSEFERALPNRVGDKQPHIANNIQLSADHEAMHVFPPDPTLHPQKDIATQNFDTQFLVHQKNIETALKQLDERSEQIVRMRFGIGVNRTYTLKEISSALLISGERARQISNQAIKTLSLSLKDYASLA